MSYHGHVEIENDEALEKAARMAEEDGDFEHAKRLRERAIVARRRKREASAGVRNIGWNFPNGWMK